MKNDLISVNIYGQEYTLKTDGTKEYINKIANYVESKMKEIEKTGLDANSQQLKIAVLASMNIADELLQTNENSNRILNKVELKGKSFIEYIDDRIKKIEKTSGTEKWLPNNCLEKLSLQVLEIH